MELPDRRSWEVYNETTRRWTLLPRNDIECSVRALLGLFASRIRIPLAVHIKWLHETDKRKSFDTFRPAGVDFDPLGMIRAGYTIVNKDVPVQSDIYRKGLLPDTNVVLLYRAVGRSDCDESEGIEILVFEHTKKRVSLAVPKVPPRLTSCSAPPTRKSASIDNIPVVEDRKSKTEPELTQMAFSEITSALESSSLTPRDTEPSPKVLSPLSRPHTRSNTNNPLRISVLDNKR